MLLVSTAKHSESSLTDHCYSEQESSTPYIIIRGVPLIIGNNE